MLPLDFPDTPFELQLSFSGVLDRLSLIAADSTQPGAQRAGMLMAEASKYPELREGITDLTLLDTHKDLLKQLLEDYFPPALTHNEIKAVNIPYSKLFYNPTERFKKIMADAGTDSLASIRDFDDHQFYVLSCCIILNDYYETNLDFTKPLFYDVTSKEGITRHYRILYNADFLEVLPNGNALPLSSEDIENLLNNYDDLALWKEKFPPGSWLLKGFAIITLFDATVENAVSLFKEQFLGVQTHNMQQSIESIFRSIFKIADLQIGVSVYNKEDNSFNTDTYGPLIKSFVLPDREQKISSEVLCVKCVESLIEKQVYFAVSNTTEYLEKNPDNTLAKQFLAQGIHSFILAPVVKNHQLFGILEVVSTTPKALNSINAHKMEVVMPFVTDAVERLDKDLENQIEATIQAYYTSIHKSVYWKFRKEAAALITNMQRGEDYKLQEIIFHEVWPLYGQVDIKGSSEARNASVQRDLKHQLKALIKLLHQLADNKSHTDCIAQLEALMQLTLKPISSSTEQEINNYIVNGIEPLLKQVNDILLLPAINEYFNDTEKHHGKYHTYRRKYENTVSTINDKMAEILDLRQEAAQQNFPHYYERFKTDGVEHNLYIGASIAPQQIFHPQHQADLRIWQLETLCEMEKAHHEIQSYLPYPLDVTTLILVYHSTIDIRFRMDEKRFDVDGSYNARFEIVKKRIDKACIKHTHDRITIPGKITIVYSNEDDGIAYKSYIQLLQNKRLMDSTIEEMEVEDLQGVTGLKALRVGVIH